MVLRIRFHGRTWTIPMGSAAHPWLIRDLLRCGSTTCFVLFPKGDCRRGWNCVRQGEHYRMDAIPVNGATLAMNLAPCKGSR